jgi:protein phosphatase
MKQIELKIPKLSLVILIGVSGSGKSSFARKHFSATEVVSSDQCRALVSDNENDMAATTDAFELLHFIVAKRLAAGKFTVIDATNVQIHSRQPLITIARQYHARPVAIILDLPEKVCQERNKERPDRDFGPHVIRQQRSQLRRSLKSLKREGFLHIWKLTSEEEVNTAIVERVPLWNDKTDLHGPFDIIGDVHGCYDELVELLDRLGYMPGNSERGFMPGPVYSHPEGRMAIFLGDLVDRGPKIVDTIKLVHNMVHAGSALCVPGNHDIKLLRKLNGKNVQITHGLGETLSQMEELPQPDRTTFTEQARQFIDSLISHYMLDDGRLVVAHAGLKQEMQGRGSGKVREFCLYGETTGETDEFGLPIRHNWAAEYRGSATVVFGHTPVPEPEWFNRTINIDTGCVFGGKLTALRYPEKELLSVEAAKIYCEPARPLLTEEQKKQKISVQQQHDDLLEAEDVIGKRYISTRLRSNITIREEHAFAALEVMSRFAVNPKWLIYLPPTMSPSETSQRNGFLEYPQEAFTYYRAQGIPTTICQEKHMGSRAVVIVCLDEDAATKHFGVENEGAGIIYTRTGRRFFNDPGLEEQLLQVIRKSLDESGFWHEFKTEWVCLDCELMPWSEKAQELLKSQYAAVGSAATAALSAALKEVKVTAARTNLDTGFKVPPLSSTQEFDIGKLLPKMKNRLIAVERYIESYRQYCWPVSSLADLKLAPFHILATASGVHVDRDHEWHMKTIAGFCAESHNILIATPYITVDVTDEDSIEAGCDWWNSMTEKGGEGMVVKPFHFIAKGKSGLAQPAVKCRGPEYLRIIYGPEYSTPENLERLRSRYLARKRSLALREFALGIEALERYLRKEPLRRVHECVFGILALESEPVDPRL